MNKNLPTLPNSLLDLIGEYGFDSTVGLSQIERLRRWELLIMGIKDYAASVATQPPQDERIRLALEMLYAEALACGFDTSSAAMQAARLSLAASAPVPEQNYAECWVCGKPMDGKSEDDCHCFHRKELATPQPVAAEVAMLNKLPRFRYGYSYNGGDARSLGYIADPEGPIVRYADIVAALVPTQKVEMNKITPPPAYACIHRANGKDKCSRWCGDSAKCIASPMLEDARAAIELRYTSQGAASEPESTNPYRVGSNAALWWQCGHDSTFSGTGSDESREGEA